MIETCCHELAHYIQYVKHGDSSCESSLEKEDYDEGLAKEHKEIREEIFELVRKD